MKKEYHLKASIYSSLFENIENAVKKNCDLINLNIERNQLYSTITYIHPNETRVKIQKLYCSPEKEFEGNVRADIKIQFKSDDEIPIIEAKRDLECMVNMGVLK